MLKAKPRIYPAGDRWFIEWPAYGFAQRPRVAGPFRDLDEAALFVRAPASDGLRGHIEGDSESWRYSHAPFPLVMR